MHSLPVQQKLRPLCQLLPALERPRRGQQRTQRLELPRTHDDVHAVLQGQQPHAWRRLSMRGNSGCVSVPVQVLSAVIGYAR